VVDEGTGKRAAIPGYTVAGKTGTAQKALPGEGYVAGRYVASFVGFAPARRPAVACLIAVDEPRGGLYHGGDVAAEIFSTVVGQTLFYLGVPPDRRETDPWAVAERPAATGQGEEIAAEPSPPVETGETAAAGGR
jgi:cell division protein FtsI/penicillin-binding protein 2